MQKNGYILPSSENPPKFNFPEQQQSMSRLEVKFERNVESNFEANAKKTARYFFPPKILPILTS